MIQHRQRYRSLQVWAQAVMFLCFYGYDEKDAGAITLGFTDPQQFNSELVNRNLLSQASLTFEPPSVRVGEIVSSGENVGGFQFFFDFDGIDMVVSNQFDTFGGDNYLGLNDGGNQMFYSGDSFIMRFRSANGLGLFIIGSPGDVKAGDFILDDLGGGTVSNVKTPFRTLQDGGEVFFLGLLSTDSQFSDALLLSLGDVSDPTFLWNVDTILRAQPVPEPHTLLLIVTGIVTAWYWRRRKDLLQEPSSSPLGSQRAILATSDKA